MYCFSLVIKLQYKVIKIRSLCSLAFCLCQPLSLGLCSWIKSWKFCVWSTRKYDFLLCCLLSFFQIIRNLRIIMFLLCTCSAMSPAFLQLPDEGSERVTAISVLWWQQQYLREQHGAVSGKGWGVLGKGSLPQGIKQAPQGSGSSPELLVFKERLDSAVRHRLWIWSNSVRSH